MFERLQKPFLTVETGEAYQPIRLCYDLKQAKHKYVEILESLACCDKTGGTWSWIWQAECADLNFSSIDSYKPNFSQPLRIGSISVKNHRLYINLPSFKRACLAVNFFHSYFASHHINLLSADFINKVYAIDERLPHGFSELFKDDELERLVSQRHAEYHQVQRECEQASSAEEALTILNEYTSKEAKNAFLMLNATLLNIQMLTRMYCF